MKTNCNYCGSLIDETDEVCPNCGATNINYKKTGNGVPQTIAELQQWYTDHNLPAPETTRFFIGVDYKKPKAFGIYQDQNTGNFVVYKNKDTGERAIRYEGKDEAYAVNELYLKLKERIAEEKAKNNIRRSKSSSRKKSNSSFIISTVTIIVIIVISILISVFSPNRGYYKYNGSQYYYLDDDWYIYNGVDWVPTSVDSELSKNYHDYYESSYYDSSWGGYDFEETSYYSNWQESSDWDSDSNWNSGDTWDAGGGDWGNDW